ncbi:MAG: BREX-1 system adenine-specific DNA-methyltransferase PglX, partial [Nostoc sp.]|uniref:BREX-1 system adenine-specific DNA-methyltransferase PglX n=1 Tax=Nostoc sp. TaxID=1180 RepID=UPI002FFB0762
ADIPAATQLFTPHWIVQYMVENSLGRLWLESHPESRLRECMPYYLENPNDNGEGEKPQVLTPQELTVIDPACGSGHILVYAFDLLFEIYKEQGYLERDIPALILTHNLYGLDIDERAAQLASFAVFMKARAKNSRILRKSLALNITVVRPTHSQTLPLATELIAEDWQPLIEAFKDADNLGSLITPPAFDSEKLKWQLNNLEASDSLFREYVPALRRLLLQAELLSKQYWVVVANPPYMGNKNLNQVLKDFASKNYPDSKSDAFSMFVERIMSIVVKGGTIGLMTPLTWMFLSSYENFRKNILNKNTITSLIQPEYNAFWNSAHVALCTVTLLNKLLPKYKGTFIDLNNFYGADLQPIKLLEAIKNPSCGYLYYAKGEDFAKIPGNPIIYKLSNQFRNAFQNNKPLSYVGSFKRGTSTSNNERFLRYWYEVEFLPNTDTPSHKWFPYNKGGDKRRWYGNLEYLINWENNGYELIKYKNSYPRNIQYNFLPSISYGSLTSSEPSFRFYKYHAHDQAGNFFPLNDIATLECLFIIMP